MISEFDVIKLNKAVNDQANLCRKVLDILKEYGYGLKEGSEWVTIKIEMEVKKPDDTCHLVDYLKLII